VEKLGEWVHLKLAQPDGTYLTSLNGSLALSLSVSIYSLSLALSSSKRFSSIKAPAQKEDYSIPPIIEKHSERIYLINNKIFF